MPRSATSRSLSYLKVASITRNLKRVKDDYTKGDNRYPKNRQQTLHLLDNHSKTSTPQPTPSEGTSFAQKGDKSNKGNGNRDNGNKDKDPKTHRARKGKGKQKQKQLSDEEARPDAADDDDEESRSSHESRSSQAPRSRQARFEKKVAQDMKLQAKDRKRFVKKSVTQAFAQFQ
jgi:hypothetical protein